MSSRFSVNKSKKCPRCLGQGFIYGWTRPHMRRCWSCLGTGEYLTAEELGKKLAEKHLERIISV